MSATNTAEKPRSGRRKALLRLVLLVVVGVAGLGVLSTFGTLLSSITRSGDAAAVFTDAAELPDDLLDAVTWLPDVEEIPRPMEPLTRADVTSAWIRAWSQLTIAAETGETGGMEVYFSNSALKGVLAGAESSSGRPVFQIGHELQLTFYSEDGQVVGLTALKSRLLRAEPFDDGKRRFFESEESFEAVMILEDGNWRIQHWVRQSVEGDWLVGGSPLPTDELLRTSNVGPSIEELHLHGLSASAPAGHGAAEEVVAENPTTVDILAAFGMVDSDQGSVLRVPIGFDEVGGDTPTDEMLAVIGEVLDVASDQERRVVLSLFEGRTDFRPSRWDADRRHLDAIHAAVNGHEALLSLEVANLAIGSTSGQPDLFDAWLVSMDRTPGVENPVITASKGRTPLSVGGTGE